MLAFAFSLGLWLAGAAPTWPTARWPWLFPCLVLPPALLAPLAARLGRRRLALTAAALAFLAAGLSRRPAPGPQDGPCAAALSAAGLPAPGPRARAALEIEGVLRSAPRFRGDGGSVEAVIDRARPPRGPPLPPRPPPAWTQLEPMPISLHLPAGLRPLPGDRIRAEVELDEPPPPLPGREGAVLALRRRGIRCVGRPVDGRLVALDGGGVHAAIERARRAIASRLAARMEPTPGAALVIALALGDRERIDRAQAARFADSGLAHLVSVSGLHLALAVLGVFRALAWLLARAKLAEARRVAAGLVLPLVPLYAGLTGAQPPVVRAAVGAGIYLVAIVGARAPEPWSALAAAALVVLGLEPAALFEASFQLSFAACAGLLAVAPALRALVPLPRPPPEAPRWRRLAEGVLATLVTTSAATLATLPFTALHFGRTSLASLPANLVAVPLGLLVTALAAAAAAAAALHGALAVPFLFVAEPLARLLDALAALFAAMPGARLELARPGPVELLLLSTAVVAVAALRRTPRRALALLALACLALWLRALPAPPDGRLHVEFLPVGQGDATLITLPDGAHLLVDAGGDPSGRRDVGAEVLLPQLRARGVERLRALVASHLHPDHVGGMPAVIRALDVDELWTSGRELSGPWGAPLAAALAERRVPRRIVSAGSAPLELGGVRVELLGPPDVEGGDDPLLGANDASVVLRLVHGDVAVLLPGDVELEGELALVEDGRPIEAQLLKAPHHGSRTSSSSELLERVRPRHVVFCVGHRNGFGFPHEEVERRYRERRCSLHRTDRGAVHFVSDGSRIEHVAP